MRGELSWYVARTGGFLAWGLSAFSILWGLLITSKALGQRISRPRLLDLHRFIGGLSVIFTLVHIIALRLHRFEYLDFEFKELLVPMASDWHPGAVAYGILAFYLLVAVEITSLFRRRIPASLWRRVHYGGFVVFLLGSIHALKVGTDVQNPLIWWPSAVLCAAIVGLAVTRAMSSAQDTTAGTADIETGLFGTLDTDDAPRPNLALYADAPAPTPAAPAPIAQALATTTAFGDIDRAALLERTRRSLEQLDITAYPRADVPAELLTTRPEQPAPSAAAADEAKLPSRPTDIALRYARLRNPANPPVTAQPSFQAVIPADAQRQSNWGQPPAGWGAPASAPAEAPQPAPAEVAPRSTLRGLPDPASRTSFEDQWATRTTDQREARGTSLDWRTPSRPAPPPATPAAPPAGEFTGAPGTGDETTPPMRSGLPSRTPQRLARSTEPARTPLDWKPQRLERRPMGGAPPPPEPDPETGEVPSEQYRAWLREWLAFAESYEG